MLEEREEILYRYGGTLTDTFSHYGSTSGVVIVKFHGCNQFLLSTLHSVSNLPRYLINIALSYCVR